MYLAGEFQSDEEEFKMDQSIPSDLDMECPQYQLDEVKIEVEETKVTSAIDDVHDSTNFASILSGLLNR